MRTLTRRPRTAKNVTFEVTINESLPDDQRDNVVRSIERLFAGYTPEAEVKHDGKGKVTVKVEDIDEFTHLHPKDVLNKLQWNRNTDSVKAASIETAYEPSCPNCGSMHTKPTAKNRFACESCDYSWKHNGFEPVDQFEPAFSDGNKKNASRPIVSPEDLDQDFRAKGQFDADEDDPQNVDDSTDSDTDETSYLKDEGEPGGNSQNLSSRRIAYYMCPICSFPELTKVGSYYACQSCGSQMEDEDDGSVVDRDFEDDQQNCPYCGSDRIDNEDDDPFSDGDSQSFCSDCGQNVDQDDQIDLSRFLDNSLEEPGNPAITPEYAQDGDRQAIIDQRDILGSRYAAEQWMTDEGTGGLLGGQDMSPEDAASDVNDLDNPEYNDPTGVKSAPSTNTRDTPQAAGGQEIIPDIHSWYS